jgi:hypothetical protein
MDVGQKADGDERAIETGCSSTRCRRWREGQSKRRKAFTTVVMMERFGAGRRIR